AQGKHTPWSNAYFPANSTLIQLHGINALIQLHPQYKATLRTAYACAIGKIIGNSTYILQAVGMQGMAQLTQMTFVPAGFQETGNYFLRNGSGGDGMHLFHPYHFIFKSARRHPPYPVTRRQGLGYRTAPKYQSTFIIGLTAFRPAVAKINITIQVIFDQGYIMMLQ